MRGYEIDTSRLYDIARLNIPLIYSKLELLKRSEFNESCRKMILTSNLLAHLIVSFTSVESNPFLVKTHDNVKDKPNTAIDAHFLIFFC